MLTTSDTIELDAITEELGTWLDRPVPPSQISGPLPVQHPRRLRPCAKCRARRRRAAGAVAMATALAGAGLTLAYAVLVQAPPHLAAAEAVLPARAVAAAPQIPPQAVPPLLRPVEVMPVTTPVPRITHRATAAPAAVAPSSPAPSPAAPAPSPSATVPAPQPSPSVTRTTAPPAPSGTLGARLLVTAETMTGVWYLYGGDTPAGFDCSGLVYWAALQLGITLPRDTYGMLAGSPHLVQVSSPEPGDLAFFGPGHVELYVRSGVTFGAQQSGTRIGYHDYGRYYVPTMYYRLV